MSTILASINVHAPSGKVVDVLAHNVWEDTSGETSRIVCVPKGSADVETATTNASVEGLGAVVPVVHGVSVNGGDVVPLAGEGTDERTARVPLADGSGVATVTITRKRGDFRIRASVGERAMVRTSLSADERDAVLAEMLGE